MARKPIGWASEESEAEFRKHMCEGKAPLTAQIAKKVIQRPSKGTRTAYKCPFCKSWHVGNQPEGELRNRRYRKRPRSL